MSETARHFHLCLIAPPNTIASACLAELVESFGHTLQDLGHRTTAGINQIESQATNIVFGAHQLPRGFDQLPAHSILYNTEQIFPGSAVLNGALEELVARHETWDYSRRNLQAWAARGLTAVRHLPIAYVAQLTRIAPAPTQDIDVLFYGQVNSRRLKILDALKARGLNLVVAGGVYGGERDALIARSKVVLNLHYYDTHIFETARVSYLLANRKAVVAEVQADTEIDPRYAAAVEARAYEDLVQGCLDLLADPVARRKREDNGLAIMQSMPLSGFLAPLIADSRARSN